MATRKTAGDKLVRFRSAVVRTEPQAVDPSGGRYKSGLIRGAAAITRGEALGHGAWVDDVFLSQVAEALNSRRGHKVRFTHPDVSSDGLGKYLGRAHGGRVEGDQVIVEEIHLAKSSRNTPDGDLGGYVLELADEDPEAFGLSIVFYQDETAAKQFHKDNLDDDGEFSSPDPDNLENLPHVRLESFRGVDFVDSPAANPDGLFHRENEMAKQGVDLAEFALGISSEAAPATAFGIEPERLRQFVARFLEERDLTITHAGKAQDMTLATKKPAKKQLNATVIDPVVEDQKPVDEVIDGTDKDAEATEEEVTEPDQPVAAYAGPGEKFLAAFGDQGGIWFAQGKSFDECSKLHAEAIKAENEKLKSENETLKKQLGAAAALGGVEDGVSSSDESRNGSSQGKRLMEGGGITIRTRRN